MKSREQILKEKPLTTRLHLATTQFKDVEKEHIWALATAHSEGTDLEVRIDILDCCDLNGDRQTLELRSLTQEKFVIF